MRIAALSLILEILPYAALNGVSVWAALRGRHSLGDACAWLAYGVAAFSLAASTHYPLNFVVWMALGLGQTVVVVNRARRKRAVLEVARAAAAAQIHRDALEAVHRAEREGRKP